jgi:hypothetical protein
VRDAFDRKSRENGTQINLARFIEGYNRTYNKGISMPLEGYYLPVLPDVVAIFKTIASKVL